MEVLVFLIIVAVVATAYRINLFFTDREKYWEVVERERARRNKVIGFGAKMAGAYMRHKLK